MTPTSSFPGRQTLLWLIVCSVLTAGTLYLYYGYPQAGLGPRQPIYFSHRVHAGVKNIDWRTLKDLDMENRMVRRNIEAVVKTWLEPQVVSLGPDDCEKKNHPGPLQEQ